MLFFTLTNIIQAQLPYPGIDATKVSPNTYKLLLENDYTRIVKVTAKPGDRDEWHSHMPMAVYIVTDMKIRIHTPDGKFTDMEGKAGQTMWMDGVEKHSMENMGSTDTNIILVEFKNL